MQISANTFHWKTQQKYNKSTLFLHVHILKLNDNFLHTYKNVTQSINQS